ncbi:MAG: HD domain-containing protein [Anaeroplasmataceae bacterium]
MMYSKLKRNKVFRDPIYGYIAVSYKIIDDLIDTKEFQRLRRIRQLAGLSMVFHTAEHSRFCHSLGAYEMARKIIHHAEGIKEEMSEYEQLIFLIAALLHDVGHGPYSHAFEAVMPVSHEEMTVKIIMGDTEINKVLSIHPSLAEDVASVISHSKKFELIEALVSSQLDVDRMDYLQRDSYFTGALYGTIDVNRIIRSMKIVNKEVVYRASGAPAVESYLMARYHMYNQIYYHQVARSYELLLQSIFFRIFDLIKENVYINATIDAFIDAIKTASVESYLEIDDAYVNGFIKQLSHSDDSILNDLCNRFLNRKLYEVIDLKLEADVNRIERVRKKYNSDPILHRYYYEESTLSQYAYKHTDDIDKVNDIKILLPSGEIISLETYSPIVKGLIDSANNKFERIFYGKGE